MSDSLLFEPVSAWKRYATPEHAVRMDALAEACIAFLTRCKTERETVADVTHRLLASGFVAADDTFDPAADRVFRTCRGKALFAARRGRQPLSSGVRLITAHTDTPRLDLKQRPLTEQADVAQAKTHYYGGIRKYQWLARPLALHGVIVKEDGTRIAITLGEDPADPVFTIADLLPHLAQKEATKTLAEAFDAEKLNIIVGHKPVLADDQPATADQGAPAAAPAAKPVDNTEKDPVKRRVLELLHARHGITEEDLFSAEIQAVPAGPARSVGLDGAIIGGYGQDDRICVFAALEALLAAHAPEQTACLMLWDKEEIGSEGSTGAQSAFLETCLKDLALAWEKGALFRHFMPKSRAISADVHGAIDPDWQDLHEKQNAARFGYGPCFSKFTGSRGKLGANDAHPEYIGWLRALCNTRGIPWQMAELGKVDAGGGGTVALYLAAFGMDVIDMGPALLAMHSPFELSSKVDMYATCLAYTAFYEVP